MRLLSVLVGIVFAAGVSGAEPDKKPILIVKSDAFKTLVNPNCSHCRDEAKRRGGELRADDRVLCWIRGYSEGGAIPYRFFLNSYRVISDTYGVFVHDPEAGYARGFAPSLDFTFHGWRNGVLVMKHKDGTLFSGLSGLAFDGPRKGERLQPVPTLVSDWGFWLERYPQAVAYHMYEKYQPVSLPKLLQADSVASRRPADPRLQAEEEVVGVWDGKQARAYPLAELAKKNLIHEELNGQARNLLWLSRTRTAAVYAPLASPPAKSAARPRPVTLAYAGAVPAAPFTDRETGSNWDIAGRAVDGELKGWTLTWMDGVVVKWFAWAAEHPDTTIYGRK